MAAIDLAHFAEAAQMRAGAQGGAFDAWDAFLAALERVGIDRVNYTFMTGAPANDDAPVLPSLSTLSGDWLKHYAERRLDVGDPLVAYTLAGGVAPLLFNAEAERAGSEAAASVCEAGMRGGMFVPLQRSPGSLAPTAGLVLGSSLRPEESLRLLSEDGLAVVAAAHMFHARAAGLVLRERDGAERLSERQRACLQALARGRRTAAIAHELGLSEPTVALHLKNARQRLKARSLPEAVARALLFGEIEPV